MSNNHPIDDVIKNGIPVDKSADRGYEKLRARVRVSDADEIRNTKFSGQFGGLYKADTQTNYDIDTDDTTSPDDGVTCIRDADGNAWKPISSVPVPTSVSLGGVYQSDAVPTEYVTGLDGDGNLLRAQPAASDLSDGLTGTGAVVRGTSPVITTPTGIVKNDVGLGNVDNTSNATERAAARTLTSASISGSANDITNLTTAMFATNVVDTDGTLAANSDTRIASQKAVKAYVDSVAQGLDPKASVRAATTANITLSGTQTIDGVSVVATDRVLVKNQSTASQNGIYICAAGAWSRALDFDAWTELPGAYTFVESGTVNGTTAWTCTVAPGGTIGTTSIPFTQFYGAGTYTASTGLTLTGTAFSIDSTVATLTGGQTFTNKVLTAPDINGGTVDNITSLGIRSSGAAFDLQMVSSEVFTGNRALTWVLGNAARTITLGGNPTINGGTHSGTNTGDQTITLTGDVTGSGTGSFATTIGANKVTLGMMAQIATARFLGRTTASTGDVEALTAAQVTAALNAMVGDSGSGGTKGLVPAAGAGDAAAGKFLKADGTFAVPAGGGGGGMTDEERQNATLNLIYQSKALAGPRQVINQFADGFKSSGGINAGSSSNYTLDTGAGSVTNTVSVGTQISTSGKTKIGNMTGGGGLVAAFDGTTTQASASCAQLNPGPSGYSTFAGIDWGSGVTNTIHRFRLYAASDNALLGGGGGGTVKLQGSNDNSAWTDLYTSTTVLATAGSNVDVTSGITTTTPYRYHRIAINGTGVNIAVIAEVQFFGPPTTNDLTLTSVSTAVSTIINNGRVLFEFDNAALPSLNTDLLAWVSCDGGSHFTQATLSASGIGQSGRIVAESADTSVGANSGTSMVYKITTANGKLVPLYGSSIKGR